MQVLQRLSASCSAGSVLRSLLLEAQPAASAKQRLLVEFSSPNIAKPFHVGHVRSTINGQFICNLLRLAGHHVTAVNFLGDWGHQFGLLLLAWRQDGARDLAKLGSPETILDYLLQLYVDACAQAEHSPEFDSNADLLLSELESGGCPEYAKFWQSARALTVSQLKQVYAELGVSFDLIEFESDYNCKAVQLVANWHQLGLLAQHEHSGNLGLEVGGTFVSLGKTVKDHVTSLYLSRDVAAVLGRFQRLQFDRIFYVVGNEQRQHFKHLQLVLGQLGGADGARLAREGVIEHVRLGAVSGMSTRSGQVVMVDELLRQGQQAACLFAGSAKYNAHVAEAERERVSRRLAVASLIMHELRHQRLDRYKFDWHTATAQRGPTAAYLLYCYARLCSLQREHQLLHSQLLHGCVDFGQLVEPQAAAVCQCLAEVQPSLVASLSSLEAAPVVECAYQLVKATNVAYARLPVREQPEQLALPRLALFGTVKRVLHELLELLCVQPLQAV